MKKKNKLHDPLYREQVSGWLHVVGAVITLLGIFVLDYHASKKGNIPLYCSTAAFMASMLVVYIASAAYHIIPHNAEWKQVFRRIDQAMIYLLIAGTYTPICVVALRDYGGLELLEVVWTIAITGAILKLAKVNLHNILQVVIYIVLACAGYFKQDILKEIFGPDGTWWFFAGVVAYLVGAAFYLIEEIFDPKNKGWNHEAFHICVMAGCSCHYWMMQEYLLRL